MVVVGNAISVWTETIAMYTAHALGIDLLHFESPETVSQGIEVTEEQLGHYFGDADLIYRQVSTAAGSEAMDAMTTWRSLKAVPAGGVHQLTHHLNTAGAHATTALVNALVEGTRKLV